MSQSHQELNGRRREKPRPSRSVWHPQLTPSERRALLLVAGLFVLGALVRWFRCAYT